MRRISLEEKKTMVTDYYKSGLSVRDFCETRNLSKTNMYNWIRQDTKSYIPKSGFIEITRPYEPQAGVSIKYPNGIEVRLPMNLPLTDLLQQVGNVRL